jgi:hypothetical protein
LFAASIPLISAQSQTTQSIENVTFCQIAENPSAYVAKQVRVRAIYRYALEERELEQPECCPGNKLGKMRVVGPSGNPDYPDQFTRRANRLAKRLMNGMSGVALVDLVGRVDRGVFQIERIEQIERLSRPADRDHDPSWVPRDCGSRILETPQK